MGYERLLVYKKVLLNRPIIFIAWTPLLKKIYREQNHAVTFFKLCHFFIKKSKKNNQEGCLIQFVYQKALIRTFQTRFLTTQYTFVNSQH